VTKSLKCFDEFSFLKATQFPLDFIFWTPSNVYFRVYCLL